VTAAAGLLVGRELGESFSRSGVVRRCHEVEIDRSAPLKARAALIAAGRDRSLEGAGDPARTVVTVGSNSKEERARRRELVERQQTLLDLEEEFQAAKTAAQAAGDSDRVRALTDEFAPKRTAMREEMERRGEREAGVAISTAMWIVWGRVAVEHERLAHEALDRFLVGESSSDLQESFERSVVAAVAAALTLEGLYGSVCYLIPDVGVRTRWKNIVRTLDELFDLSTLQSLESRVKLTFELRDYAVHPWETMRPAVQHPEAGVGNVSEEMATLNPRAASDSIDTAFDVLAAVMQPPWPDRARSARWVKQNASGVHQLLELRSNDGRSTAN
jgi:hypothetical protein